MSDCYELNVAGVTRQLPIIPISPELAIASFVILGDCELVTAAAPLLAQKLPKVDYLVTAEAKGIPLVHEVSRLLGLPYYIVARKSVKPYMAEPLVDEVVSITTQKAQTLCLDGKAMWNTIQIMTGMKMGEKQQNCPFLLKISFLRPVGGVQRPSKRPRCASVFIISFRK